jgi:outer membrane lipoprotein-sorting protein
MLAVPMRLCSSVPAVLILCSSLAAGEPDLTAVKQWIAHARTMKSVVVEFTQERHLRTVTKPLVSAGRMWFKAPGALRWQVGEPPKLIALQQTRGGDFTVLDPKKREARVFSSTALKTKGGPFAFIEASFPTSLEEFQEKFRIESVKVRDEVVEISGQMKDRRMDVAVLKIVFIIDPASHRLRSLEVWFHDGSKMVNRFSIVAENTHVPDQLFTESLEGWKVTKE